jgi:hypothetical protein
VNIFDGVRSVQNELATTRRHFGLNVQVQLLLMTIFFFLLPDAALTFLSFSILCLILAGSAELALLSTIAYAG